MEKLSIFSFLIVFVTFLFSSAAAFREVDDESGFSYDPNSPDGPANWGQIRPEWFLCGNGTMQSPIYLKNAKIVTNPWDLQAVYSHALATLINRGLDISLRWENNPGYIQINGTRYNLEQCHWHTPTEHAIHGQRYDVELHCVHTSNSDRIAVLAILYKIGLIPDPFLALLTAPLIILASGEKQASAGIIDPRQVQIDSSQYYRYIGSLTTPPCYEDVVWTVFRQVKSVSRAQVKLLQAAVQDGSGFNARPLQPLNNRTVLLYKQFSSIISGYNPNPYPQTE